ncbi:MAG: transcriptional regulator [Coriobacteriia bacterium]|nr:transcriptional regulator [Coriobacteriia bacterium]
MQLTKAQTRFLKELELFIDNNGYAPTTRELVELLDYRSNNAVRFHLINLKSLGYIDYVDGKSRTIKVLKSI